ncbi:MAG: TIGR03067 domain-containing protein [Acidobacteriota bacterium]
MIGKMLMLLSISFLVFTPFSNPNAVQDDSKLIEGTWIMVSFEMGGQQMPQEALKDSNLVLKDGRYTFQDSQGTYKINPTKKPKAMDLVGTKGPNEGKTSLAIYELTANTFRICYELEGKERPTEFKTAPDKMHFLASYKRGK